LQPRRRAQAQGGGEGGGEAEEWDVFTNLILPFLVMGALIGVYYAWRRWQEGAALRQAKEMAKWRRSSADMNSGYADDQSISRIPVRTKVVPHSTRLETAGTTQGPGHSSLDGNTEP